MSIRTVCELVYATSKEIAIASHDATKCNGVATDRDSSRGTKNSFAEFAKNVCQPVAGGKV